MRVSTTSGNVTFSRGEIFYGQKVTAVLAATDDVNVFAAKVHIEEFRAAFAVKLVERNRFELG